MRSRDALIEWLRAGGKAKYLFFWGHEQRAEIGKQCLSQWYPAPFVVDGVLYPTAEHFMMAGKARLFADADALQQILAASHPKRAKDLGRRVRGFDEASWEKARFEIVVAGSVAKFGQNAELGEFLRKTSGRVLVEASPADEIWGIGLAEDHPDAREPERWRGLNLLGFALMEARSRL
jgi:ribA/ribD-fused uncharacterized protein